jgi:cell division septum initiation protein DivIVA
MAKPPVPDSWVPQKFNRTLRGYDPEAVDRFVTSSRIQIEELTQQNRSLNERLKALEEKVDFHEERATAVQDALVMAQTMSTEVQDKAEAEAREVRRKASEEAEALLKAAEEDRKRVENEAEELRREADRLRAEALAELEEERLRAQSDAEAEAARIRDTAKQEAARIVEEATREADAVTAQVERLEKRRNEFLEFLANELEKAPPVNGDGDQEPQTLEVYFSDATT